jgi:flagellar protein FliO/FliZ
MFRAYESSSCLHQGSDNAMKKLLCNVFVGLLWPSAAFAADTTERGSLLIGLLVPLITITLALLAMLWWLRRGKTLAGSGPLKVVQAVAVGSRERVVVLDAQGRRLLIGVTPSKIELLAELRSTDAPEVM